LFVQKAVDIGRFQEIAGSLNPVKAQRPEPEGGLSENPAFKIRVFRERESLPRRKGLEHGQGVHTLSEKCPVVFGGRLRPRKRGEPEKSLPVGKGKVLQKRKSRELGGLPREGRRVAKPTQEALEPGLLFLCGDAGSVSAGIFRGKRER
jgi:hypothetical protein